MICPLMCHRFIHLLGGGGELTLCWEKMVGSGTVSVEARGQGKVSEAWVSTSGPGSGHIGQGDIVQGRVVQET
jgi:hypothetical protein